MQPTRISALQGRKVDVKMMKVVNLLNSTAITVTSSYESSIRNVSIEQKAAKQKSIAVAENEISQLVAPQQLSTEW